MTLRQYLFCLILGPPLAIMGIACLAIYPLAVGLIWLLGEKEPWREAWGMLTEPPVEMFLEGYRGI